MNKLMLFPLGFMFILTIISSVYTSHTYLGSSTDMTVDGNLTITEDGAEKTGSVDIPGSESQSFDMWGSTGAMLIIVAAIAVGILAGIQIVGSGLGEHAQALVFDGVLYFGLWACLTIIARDMLFAATITSILWITLTTTFVIGLGSHMGRADG